MSKLLGLLGLLCILVILSGCSSEPSNISRILCDKEGYYFYTKECLEWAGFGCAKYEYVCYKPVYTGTFNH